MTSERQLRRHRLFRRIPADLGSFSVFFWTLTCAKENRPVLRRRLCACNVEIVAMDQKSAIRDQSRVVARSVILLVKMA